MLIDTSRVPALLASRGVEATVGSAFGTEQLPVGLRTVFGRRPAPAVEPVASRPPDISFGA